MAGFVTCPRPASCWCPGTIGKATQDIRAEVRADREHRATTYMHRIVEELESAQCRSGFLSAPDRRRLDYYKGRLKK